MRKRSLLMVFTIIYYFLTKLPFGTMVVVTNVVVVNDIVLGVVTVVEA